MASASSSAVNMLFDLANEEAELAAKQLAIANKAYQEAQQKSEMLNSYKQDYIDYLNQLLAKGLTQETHRNYQNFLQKLEQAISGQQELVVGADYERGKARAMLQVAQRKKMTYEVLIERAKKKAVQLANKREQKLMDEFAMRAKRQH